MNVNCEGCKVILPINTVAFFLAFYFIFNGSHSGINKQWTGAVWDAPDQTIKRDQIVRVNKYGHWCTESYMFNIPT